MEKKRKKAKQQNTEENDLHYMQLFYEAETLEEKLKCFSLVKNDEYKMKMMEEIPEEDIYKFIGKLRQSENIAIILNNLSDDERKKKTFQFLIKQYKGNSKQILELLSKINFSVSIPSNMLAFTLNNINVLNLDLLISIQRNVENYSQLKFKINEEDDSRNIEYSFGEISAIIAKVEELTADISEDMSEANKFYKIYSRITSNMTYDYECLRKEDDALKRWRKTYNKKYADTTKIRRNAAGLYGGLIDGKSICVGYALILHEALQFVGMKSQCVGGYSEKSGHAWNQVQIDGKWYNTDPTWDSQAIQLWGEYENMLQRDGKFDETHGKYSRGRPKTYHQCESDFDYSKIDGIMPSQIKGMRKDTYK